MIRSILASSLVALSLISSSVAISKENKITKGFYTMDAMGCMMLRECTEDVEKVTSILDISSQYSNFEDFTPVATEFNNILSSLSDIGVGVYLADEKYFPKNTRGTYNTAGNNFFLNKKYMDNPGILMSVIRHEGWHAAQDCMAGTIENSMLAIIMPEEDVPMLWRVMVERTYPKHAVPWEAEATWAGKTEGMTMKALQVCANGKMWEVYEPTPLTRKWLEEEGFIK